MLGALRPSLLRLVPVSPTFDPPLFKRGATATQGSRRACTCFHWCAHVHHPHPCSCERPVCLCCDRLWCPYQVQPFSPSTSWKAGPPKNPTSRKKHLFWPQHDRRLLDRVLSETFCFVACVECKSSRLMESRCKEPFFSFFLKLGDLNRHEVKTMLQEAAVFHKTAATVRRRLFLAIEQVVFFFFFLTTAVAIPAPTPFPNYSLIDCSLSSLLRPP